MDVLVSSPVPSSRGRRGGRGRRRPDRFPSSNAFPARRSRRDNSPPEKWLVFRSFGKRVQGTPFVPCRTFLSEKYSGFFSDPERVRDQLEADISTIVVEGGISDRSVLGDVLVLMEEACCWTPSEHSFSTLMREAADSSLENCAGVIDLTNTDKYYNPETLLESVHGMISYRKIRIPGHEYIPKAAIELFISTIDELIDNWKQRSSSSSQSAGADPIVVVHCTHGLNRSGFLIICYMCQKLGISLHDAVDSFHQARSPYRMKSILLDQLGQLYGIHDEVKDEDISPYPEISHFTCMTSSPLVDRKISDSIFHPRSIFVFDFDGTLCLTPGPIEGKKYFKEMIGRKWPHHGWWGIPKSLDPLFPIFRGPAYSDYLDAISREDAAVFVLTGRSECSRVRVENVIENLQPSVMPRGIYMKPRPDVDTISYKREVILDLARRFNNANEMILFDDRAQHRRFFAETIRADVFDIWDEDRQKYVFHFMEAEVEDDPWRLSLDRHDPPVCEPVLPS